MIIRGVLWPWLNSSIFTYRVSWCGNLGPSPLHHPLNSLQMIMSKTGCFKKKMDQLCCSPGHITCKFFAKTQLHHCVSSGICISSEQYFKDFLVSSNVFTSYKQVFWFHFQALVIMLLFFRLNNYGWPAKV